MAFEGLGWTRLLSYTIMTLCVICQTIVIKTAPNEKALQVVASALVMVACSVRILITIKYPRNLVYLCLLEIPTLLAFLSAVMSLAAPATSAFTLSLTASILTGINTVLTCAISIPHLLPGIFNSN